MEAALSGLLTPKKSPQAELRNAFIMIGVTQFGAREKR